MHPNILEYQESNELQGSFYALLCALAREADSNNFEKIQQAWPEFVEMFRKRYNAPCGVLDDREMEWFRKNHGR